MRRCSGLGLILAALPGLAEPAATGPHAVFVASYHWQEDSPLFGGISAIDTNANGTAFLAVSDSAAVVTGRIKRDASGAVVAVEASRPAVPNTKTGRPVLPPSDDAEGIALAPEGGFYISYETDNRIVRYRNGGKRWIEEIGADVLEGFELNVGAEALAIDADGALYTLPEFPPVSRGDYPIYRYRAGEWSQPFNLIRRKTWRPVGADFGPDGRLYILERDFWGLIGFMSRVRRLTLNGDRIVADEVLLETRAGIHDNLEGIAVWMDAQGAIRLTMVSDDNFMPLQRTELVDYRIVE